MDTLRTAFSLLGLQSIAEPEGRRIFQLVVFLLELHPPDCFNHRFSYASTLGDSERLGGFYSNSLTEEMHRLVARSNNTELERTTPFVEQVAAQAAPLSVYEYLRLLALFAHLVTWVKLKPETAMIRLRQYSTYAGFLEKLKVKKEDGSAPLEKRLAELDALLLVHPVE